jgi:predicted transcriptional regulator
MLQIEPAARVLSLCNETVLSVSELASKAGGKHDNVIELIRELHARGLLLRMKEKQSRGRPTHLLRTTPLGEQFVQQYNRLLDLRLFSNDNDIKKAIHHAHLTQMLEEHQISVYARFQEVNQLARNIAGTAQASESS